MPYHLYMIVADVNSLPIKDHGFGDKVPFKIGIAISLAGRLSSMQTGCPFAISVLRAWVLQSRRLAVEIERLIHKELDQHSIRGEWFLMSVPKALNIINEIFDSIGLRLWFITGREGHFFMVDGMKIGGWSAETIRRGFDDIHRKRNAKPAAARIQDDLPIPSEPAPIKPPELSMREYQELLGVAHLPDVNELNPH
jgi:hypothetical protein